MLRKAKFNSNEDWIQYQRRKKKLVVNWLYYYLTSGADGQAAEDVSNSGLMNLFG